ncbi:unnamed protein product [Peniophora sp. CBMAI 1063]|nr:unnamed protein product [Peniophora sp. CBMAI 1063]
MKANMPRSFRDLSVEVLIDNLLPAVDLSDLGSLASTNRFLAAICSDDTFWKRKCLEDFNFSSGETARTSGWKVLYRGLFRPKIFVWGEKSSGRLGIQQGLSTIGAGSGVPYPIELGIPGHRIISLAAAGMAFYALDVKGLLFAWGTLDGRHEMGNRRDGFSAAYKTAHVPYQLVMPNPIRSLSCGRLHTLALDTKCQVWTFCNWGRPFYLESERFNGLLPETTPVQAEAGWSFSAILTQSGDVLVYWHDDGAMRRAFNRQMALMDRDNGTKARPDEQSKTIPCATWGLKEDPFVLRPIPDLPVLSRNGLSEEQQAEPTKLVKIAGMDNVLIGLTNKGHVMKHGGLHNELSSGEGSRWEYLPEFSDAEYLRHNSVYQSEKLEAPDIMHITHVTAHFHRFVAYSTGSRSIILMSNDNTSPATPANIMPALQDRGVINVLLGDYHNAALTSDGKLFTWGSYSNGALGLGDPRELTPGTPGGYANEAQRHHQAEARGWIAEPPPVREPTEVRFDYNGDNGKKFVFAATAAGWHTGALVMSLETQ